MKTTIDDTKDLIERIRSASDWENHTDNELITKSLRANPEIGSIAFFGVVFYNAVSDAISDYKIILITVIFILTLITCIFLRRRLKKLHAAQDIFLARAPKNIDDIT